jgi:hypothetical protein
LQNETLNWFQYAIIIGNPSGTVGWLVEYWNTNTSTNSGSTPWPAGYTPNPPNTSPALPVIPNGFQRATKIRGGAAGTACVVHECSDRFAPACRRTTSLMVPHLRSDVLTRVPEKAFNADDETTVRIYFSPGADQEYALGSFGNGSLLKS